MKKITQIAMILALMAAVVVPGAAWAATADDADTVTVSVPSILSISDETGNFTLTFLSSANGGVTNGQTVGYQVQANNMPNSALAGALSAKINTLIDGITIRANEGRTYVNNGTASNAILEDASASVINMGTTATAVMNKPASTGASGQILNGTAFVNWGAVATRDLTTADGGSATLTVTLKDA